MRLWIAEKPELGKLIAQVLGNPQYFDGYIVCNNDTVSWAIGHLLKLIPPELKTPEYKSWSKNTLPLQLRPLQYIVIPKTEKQFNVLSGLITRADMIIHAGDPDEEGQLLIEEILSYCGNKAPVKRVLINDLNKDAVRQAMRNLQDNRAFYGLYQKALARSAGDYLFGLNMTRAYTIAAREKGHNEILSVGRVQTSVLGLVVRRYEENRDYKKYDYWCVQAEFIDTDTIISPMLVPPEDAPVDDKGRIISEQYCDEAIRSCKGQQASVSLAESEIKSRRPPLPFSLLDLQVKMNRQYGFTAEKVLEITQKLREEYRAITYNRSDCRYLSEEQFSQSPATLAMLSAFFPELGKIFSHIDSGRKSRAFNDKKISAHTAIIPTPTPTGLDQMNEDEMRVYKAIVAQYLVQFMPDKTFDSAVVEFNINGFLFRQRAIRPVSPGWSILLADRDEETLPDCRLFDAITSLTKGQQLVCSSVNSRKETSTPPPLYTEASLLEDLRRVARYVEDPRIRQLLLDRDEGKEEERGGIGTPATRGHILNVLQVRGFIAVKNKKVVPTELGLSFIHALPEVMTRPDMTALWHEQQSMIETGEISIDDFLDELEQFILQQVSDVDISGLAVAEYQCTCGGRYVRRRTDKGFFWGCSKYPDCRNTVPDRGGVPDFSRSEFERKVRCPVCGSGMKISPKAYNCSNERCGFRLWGTQFGKELTLAQATDLLMKGHTREIKGLKKKDGAKFDAVLNLNRDGSVVPTFKKKK
ncbi:DNA topoisomerase 3 [Escherichia coli]|nr:DNA topoisomerase 3 [Escherichia coli]EKM7581802.1 DNA topoisomerase 3 [Escherichia coli]